MDQDDRAEALRRCFIFGGARPETVAAMGAASSVIDYRRGTTLFMAGDEGDGLRIVLSGLIRIWISDVEGRELTLALLEPGDPFGEIALLDGMDRLANATAVEASRCLFLPAAAVDPAIDTDPALARELIGVLCDMLRSNVSAMGSFAFLGLDGRLARKLHDLALSHARIEGRAARFTRRFSQTDLANMLGVTREAVNKRLSALVHDGVIAMEAGHLRVPDIAALAARAEAEAGLRR